mgnify:CR=1 FL=1
MILLIDDKSDIPTNLKIALIKELPEFKDQIEIWNPNNLEELKQFYESNKGNPDKDSAADEDVWRRVLEQREINMVVVDHDLSELNVRISESAITNAFNIEDLINYDKLKLMKKMIIKNVLKKLLIFFKGFRFLKIRSVIWILRYYVVVLQK